MSEDTIEREDRLSPTPSAVNYRRFAIILFLFSLLFPNLFQFFPILYSTSNGEYNSYGISDTYQGLFYIMGIFTLVLAFARKRDRDWKALDRGFGIFLFLAAAAMTVNAITMPYSFWREFFSDGRWILLKGVLWLQVALAVLAGIACFKRIAFVVPLIGVTMCLMAWFSVHQSEGNTPKYFEVMKRQHFLELAGTSFGSEYHQTRTAEDVKTIFSELNKETQVALEEWVGTDIVSDLIERGDDSEFLHIFYSGVNASRNELGAIEIEIPSAPSQSQNRHFNGLSINFHTARLLFTTILLYAVWRAYRLHYEKRHAPMV